jgi:hypothetical protein
LTALTFEKFVPLIVTVWPPSFSPTVGETAEIVGTLAVVVVVVELEDVGDEEHPVLPTIAMRRAGGQHARQKPRSNCPI